MITGWQLWVLVIVSICMSGAIGALISDYKNRSLIEGFAICVLLGAIGVAILSLLPKQLPKAPPDMYPLECRRCNAVQNVEYGLDMFTCWRCDYEEPMDTALNG